MKTYIASMRFFKEGKENSIHKTFKKENEASKQVEEWQNLLIATGYVITSITMGRLSKTNEDVFIGYSED